MAYQKPQAMIHQQFQLNAAEAVDGLRAVIVGPNAILHRYADSDEKINTYVGLYDPSKDVIYSYPDRSTGGIIDKTYSKLFVDNALLIYYDSRSDATVHEFYNKAGYENVVICDDFNFASYAKIKRNAVLGTRDVQVGDYVEILAATDVEDECETTVMLSRIVGFVYSYSDPTAAVEDVDGPVTTATDDIEVIATVSGSKTSTEATDFADAVEATVTGHIDLIKDGIMAYDSDLEGNKLYAGFDINFFYSKTRNCGAVINAIITSKETGEWRETGIKPNDTIVLDADHGNLSISFPAKTGSEEDKVYDILLSMLEDEKSVKLTIKEVCSYTKIEKTAISIVEPEEGPVYNGDADDVYVLECIQGGTIGTDDVKFSVYTAYGYDSVAEVTLTDENKSAFAVGTKGLTVDFGSITTISGKTKIRIRANAPAVSKVNGIALADDLPSELWNDDGDTPDTFSIRLIAKKDIAVPAISDVTDAPNWEQEDTQFIVKEAITVTDTDFTKDDGSFIPLSLYGFGNDTDTQYIDFSKMYFEYREWSPVHSTDVEFCESVSALDNIIGPLDMDNPLKWGVYKALTNSGGVSVAYVAVKNPEDIDDWQDALSTIEGRSDVYTVVPLTTDLDKQNLVFTLINNESSAEACRWKTALFNMSLPIAVMLVGESENNATNPTSKDGAPTFGEFKDNPNESETQFTKFVCTSENAQFIDYGVEPGDTLRVISGPKNKVVATYVVDQVYSNSTLLTKSGPNVATKDVKFEIWHTLTKADEVKLIKDRAQSFSSRRIGLVWPDIVTEDQIEMPGYYLSAALAGLKSAYYPWYGLTRGVINGFDGLTRSKPRYTESQLDDLASSGVWICIEDSDGTCISRHAITTSTLDVFHSEEMMTRNMDDVSKQMYNVIDRYIGVTNVTEDTLLSVYDSLVSTCAYMVSSGQMVSYTGLTVRQHDLLLDRIVANVVVGLPFAVNNIELYITAGAYELAAVTQGTNES